MMACTWPAGTSSESPFRISLPSTAACRSLTFSMSGMDLVGEELGDHLQRLGDALGLLALQRRGRRGDGDVALVAHRDGGAAGLEVGADAEVRVFEVDAVAPP